jgi:hypothetical protein
LLFAFLASASAFAEPVKIGLWKTFEYDKPDTTPVFYGGESRAENVAVSEYCVYLDVYYADGSVTWGERADFDQGTHGWQKVCGALVPKKPVKRVEVYALCRKGSEKSHAQFRDFFLERREGKGERLYETRRSRWPYADEDEIFYSEFKGREKVDRYETVPARSTGKPGLKNLDSAVWTADSMRLVLPTDMPTEADLAAKKRLKFDLAKRGTGSGQILVSTSADTELKDVTLELPALRTRDGKPFKGSVAWHRVGYIPRGGMLFYHEKSPAFSAGWIADPLLPPAPLRVRKGSTQAFWVDVKADADAESGDYAGYARVLVSGVEKAKVVLFARVRKFSLPETFGLDTAMGLMDGFLRETYPDSWKRLSREAQDLMLDYRLNPDDISRTEFPDLDDLEHAKKRGMSGFTLLHIVPKPKNPKAKWVCYVSPEEVFSDEFYADFKKRLDPYVKELRRRGLVKYARLYGFDERPKEYYKGMHTLCDKLKADFPDVKVLTTGLMYNDISAAWAKFREGKASIDEFIVTDLYCPLSSVWNEEISDYLRSKGKQVYWYTCGGPRWPYANFANYDYPLPEGRIVLGFQTHRFRADGYLFWHVNYWNGPGNAPLDESDVFFPHWLVRSQITSPGDGILLYPGKDRVLPSIRLAQLRDGVQDYEWLQLAEKKCGRAAVDAVSGKVIRSLSDFTRDPAVLRAAQAELGDMIEKAMAGSR